MTLSGSLTTEINAASPKRSRHGASGLTFVELMISVAILAVIAASAAAMSEGGLRVSKETELKATLRAVRNAIDKYYERSFEENPGYADSQHYPKSLTELVDRKILRRVPADPFTGKADYVMISSTDEPGASSTNNENVFDIRSSSEYVALDGTKVSEW